MARRGLKFPTDIITISKLAIIRRAQMRPQRHQQPHWSKFQGGQLTSPIDGTPNCWALSLLQHIDELNLHGTEIALTSTPLSADPLMIHNIAEHLAGITVDEQKLLTAIGIQHIEDLAAPEDRNWAPMSYAHEELQFTQHITRPVTFEAPKNITLRTLMTFEQEDRFQQIHQLLGVISNPTWCCFKIRNDRGSKLRGTRN